MPTDLNHIKEFLEEKHDLYNRPSFIETDPIQIPHRFIKKENIEISGFLSSTIAWGQRKTIIRNASQIMQLLDNDPHEYIMQASATDMKHLANFKHRTFNGTDLLFFVSALKNIYTNHRGLEAVFSSGYLKNNSTKEAISHFREVFFSIPHPHRTRKHISNVDKKASAKRLNMFLMWMVRNDKRGVHFGLWNNIPSSALFLPLDVHTGNVGRKLGLLNRKQNDWQAVEEITSSLRQFDQNDPVRFDFSLFGLGVFESF